VRVSLCSVLIYVCVPHFVIAGIVVLSTDFVTRECPMAELHTLLEYHDKGIEKFVLLPIFLRLSWEECNHVATIYQQHTWQGEKPDQSVLVEWEKDVKRLCAIVGFRPDQVLPPLSTFIDHTCVLLVLSVFYLCFQ
jgi:hypothetical protein